jgi:hygromycin-B 4-O-kinase
MSELPAPDLRRLSDFLTARFGPSVRDVGPLGEGKWSRAFSFNAGGRSLVVRFGNHDEDFLKDRIAASWQQPGLPVPTFVETGEAFDTFYAVTQRADGQFLDHLTRNEVTDVLPSLFGVLDALRRVPVTEPGYGLWDRNGVGGHGSWKDALLTLETARPRVDGWRERIREWPECERAFDQGYARLQTLAELVPSRRVVIHRDLVNRNILVADAKVTSVFDWGSSMYGDHLYDIAWLTFSASYTSGFDRAQTHRLAQQHYVDQGVDADDFDLRVSCYELHIGLGALIYQAFLGDEDHARSLAGKVLSSFAQGGRTVRPGD